MADNFLECYLVWTCAGPVHAVPLWVCMCNLGAAGKHCLLGITQHLQTLHSLLPLLHRPLRLEGRDMVTTSHSGLSTRQPRPSAYCPVVSLCVYYHWLQGEHCYDGCASCALLPAVMASTGDPYAYQISKSDAHSCLIAVSFLVFVFLTSNLKCL